MQFQEKHFFIYNKIISANKRLTKAHGRLINGSEYRNCKNEIIEMFNAQRIKMQLQEKIKICKVITFLHSELWAGDIDNATKIIYDSLEKSSIIENDKFIVATENYINYNTTNIFLPKLYQNLTKEKVTIIKIIHL